jgi:hypothetical protein
VSASPVVVIVERLEAKGVRFRLDGENVKARFKEPTPVEILRDLEMLRASRAEVASLLRKRRGQKFTPAGCAHCNGIGICACAACTLRRTSHPAPCCMCRVAQHQSWVKQSSTQTCWHCHGSGKCRCIVCSVPGQGAAWVAGPCVPCHGGGRGRPVIQ